MKLTAEQLKAFDKQGFAFLPNCVSEKAIALLRIEGEAILGADRKEVWREKTDAQRSRRTPSTRRTVCYGRRATRSA